MKLVLIVEKKKLLTILGEALVISTVLNFMSHTPVSSIEEWIVGMIGITIVIFLLLFLWNYFKELKSGTIKKIKSDGKKSEKRLMKEIESEIKEEDKKKGLK